MDTKIQVTDTLSIEYERPSWVLYKIRTTKKAQGRRDAEGFYGTLGRALEAALDRHLSAQGESSLRELLRALEEFSLLASRNPVVSV